MSELIKNALVQPGTTILVAAGSGVNFILEAMQAHEVRFYPTAMLCLFAKMLRSFAVIFCTTTTTQVHPDCAVRLLISTRDSLLYEWIKSAIQAIAAKVDWEHRKGLSVTLACTQKKPSNAGFKQAEVTNALQASEPTTSKSSRVLPIHEHFEKPTPQIKQGSNINCVCGRIKFGDEITRVTMDSAKPISLRACASSRRRLSVFAQGSKAMKDRVRKLALDQMGTFVGGLGGS